MDGSGLKSQTALLLLGVALLSGCQQGQFGGATANVSKNAAANNQQLAQIQQQQQKLAGLDRRNQELVAQLAEQKRKVSIQEEQTNLYKKQLADTLSHLKQQTAAVKQAEERWAKLASQKKSGAVTIRKSNNSLVQKLQVPRIEGYEVKTEDDTVRVVIPVQQLFHQQSAQLTPQAQASLNQIGSMLARQYPQNRIAIEGHAASADPTQSGNHHTLSLAWASSVFQHLTRTGLKQHQMFIMGHGANFPRYSSGTTAGANANRRIEIVIYPESIDP